MITTDIFVKMIFDRWNASIKNYNTLINAIPDDKFAQQIAPGKNRGIYLLGHMIAVHDDIFILLGIGPRMYPELEEPFVKSPDNTATPMPSVATLRSYWTRQCEVLNAALGKLSADQWFEKHTAVSAEDFAKEPHRNKLNIIVTRTTHLAYHTGQLQLLK